MKFLVHENVAWAGWELGTPWRVKMSSRGSNTTSAAKIGKKREENSQTNHQRHGRVRYNGGLVQRSSQKRFKTIKRVLKVFP
jgi:hypothetical protein